MSDNDKLVPKIPGFSHYLRDGVVYYKTGAPRVYQTAVRGDYWNDDRPADVKAADQMAALTALDRQKHEWKKKLDDAARVADWMALFHSADELENAPAFTFAIDGFLQEKGITMIGGKSGDGKTLIAMEWRSAFSRANRCSDTLRLPSRPSASST